MKTTDRLNKVLQSARPDNISEYLAAQKDKLISEKGAFAQFFRSRLREKGLKQQDVFLKADISEKYGYKLISEEKHTRQRDYIIRLCTAAEFSLEETRKALQLYGMSPLYPRSPRDAVIIMAINNNIHDVNEIDDILKSNDLETLHVCRGLD